jgi:hypothetical protein
MPSRVRLRDRARGRHLAHLTTGAGLVPQEVPFGRDRSTLWLLRRQLVLPAVGLLV